MILLIFFDLPRHSKEERNEASKFRKHLISLGFIMKQYSVYERPIQRLETRNKIFEDIAKHLPKKGSISLYELPDYVNEKQMTLRGKNIIIKANKKPSLIVL